VSEPEIILMSIDDFSNRYGPVALVTGASSGIGAAFAEALAMRGLDVVLAARRRDRLESLAVQLTASYGVKAHPLQIDLAQSDAVAQILTETAALDVGLVISNAGFGMKGPHANNDPHAMTAMLMVNCNAPMQLAHGFIPRLRRRDSGGIIFTSSIEALMGCPYSAAYSASKALVNALGEALWAELQPDGIDVLTLCPGATQSEAAAKQGIDLSKLQHVMRAEDVARMALANIANGTTFFSSDYYYENFRKLLSLPRRDALTAMARGMKR
jgi:short-subunit dehydrogenase